MREMTQPETAEWMGCTIEEMNAAHDQIHAELCKWAGVESQSLRVARGEILDAEETRLSWLEESAALHVHRWLVALGGRCGDAAAGKGDGNGEAPTT